MGKKPGGKWRTGRSEGKRKARRLLLKCLVPAFLSENPELKTMLQAEDAYKSLRHLKIRRKPSISGPPTYPHLEGLHAYSAFGTIPPDFAGWEIITRPVTWRSLGKGQSTYPSSSLLSCSQNALIPSQSRSLFRGFVALSAGRRKGR